MSSLNSEYSSLHCPIIYHSDQIELTIHSSASVPAIGMEYRYSYHLDYLKLGDFQIWKHSLSEVIAHEFFVIIQSKYDNF